MPWGESQQVVNIDQTIGTLSARKVEVLAPISAETGTLNLNFGGVLGQANGSLRVNLGALGVGNSAGTLAVRLGTPMRLASGSVGFTAASPVRVEGTGSVGLGTVSGIKVRTGALGVGPSAGTLAVRLGTPMRLASGSVGFSAASPIRVEGTGSVGIGTLTGLKVRTGALGVGPNAGTLAVRLQTTLRLSSGSVGVGTITNTNVGSFAVAPLNLDTRNWNLETHTYWEGWLDQRRTARVNSGANLRYELGRIGRASLRWGTIGGSVRYPGPGTIQLAPASAVAMVIRARGTFGRFYYFEWAFVGPNPTGFSGFALLGSSDTTAGGDTGGAMNIIFTRGSSGTFNFRGTNYRTIISGTANQSSNVRRRSLVMRHRGTWSVLIDRGANAGWRVLGNSNFGSVPIPTNTALMQSQGNAQGTVSYFRVHISPEGRPYP